MMPPRRRWYNIVCLAPLCASLLAGCSDRKPSAYQGYVEGEYVNVASPVAGRLDKLLVQRGQTVVMVSTPQEAEELVAFLNYCGMDEFTDR